MSAGNIVNGYPDGTFGPDKTITRAEFAAIAARFDSSEYSGEKEVQRRLRTLGRRVCQSRRRKGLDYRLS